MDYPVSDFDVDLKQRVVTHRPSNIRFSFYEYGNEEDWRKSDSVVMRDNPYFVGNRSLLARAAKEAAITMGMRAQKP